jgi:superfamily I DNA/RNA helicase
MGLNGAEERGGGGIRESIGFRRDATIFVCPNGADESKCLSSVWWSSHESAREEKRIAYVAMTRTKGDLIVWMGSDSYDRLRISRPDFVARFVCTNIDEAVRTLSAPVDPT